MSRLNVYEAASAGTAPPIVTAKPLNDAPLTSRAAAVNFATMLSTQIPAGSILTIYDETAGDRQLVETVYPQTAS